MSTEEIKADINIRPEELEDIKKAQVIRLTDGTEYVRKDIASKVMQEYAAKELASLKEVVKELIPIAELFYRRQTLDPKSFVMDNIDLFNAIERAKKALR